MRTGVAALKPVYVQLACFEVDIGKLQGTQLANTQAVPKHEKQHAIVSLRIARGFAGSEQFSDFLSGEVFAPPFFAYRGCHDLLIQHPTEKVYCFCLELENSFLGKTSDWRSNTKLSVNFVY